MTIGKHFDWWNNLVQSNAFVNKLNQIPTGVQLWNDKKFIEKRIREQNIAESQAEWDEEAGYITLER